MMKTKITIIGFVLVSLLMLGLITSQDLKFRKSDDACMRWALGNEYGSLFRSELDEVWNKRHGDIFMLNGQEEKD